MFELHIQDNEQEKMPFGGTLNLLKKVIDSVSEMVEDAELKINDKGIVVQVMDSMHVCLVDIFMSKKLFNNYRCDKEITLGIKIKHFNKLIKNLKLDKEANFEMFSEDNGTILEINTESPNFVLNHKMKLYNFNIETYNFKDMDYPSIVTIKVDDLLKLPKTTGGIADFLFIEAKKDSIVFVQDSEMGTSSFILKENQDNGVLLNVNENIKKEISMKYITYMAKLHGLCESVTISLGENIPLFFDFSLDDYGFIRFYVAAKAEN